MNQENIFYAAPEQVTVETTVLATRQHPIGLAVAAKVNPIRGYSGGEPADKGGVITASGQNQDFYEVEKAEGKTWMIFRDIPEGLSSGEALQINIDGDLRFKRRKLHTAVHMCIRAGYSHFELFDVQEAEISADAAQATIVAKTEREVSQADVAAVDMSMRSMVHNALTVTAEKAKSVEDAKSKFGSLFRISDRYTLKGRVRLIHIEGTDVNACSGLHHPTTDIGPYEMLPVFDPTRPNEFRVEIRLSPCWMYWYGD